MALILSKIMSILFIGFSFTGTIMIKRYLVKGDRDTAYYYANIVLIAGSILGFYFAGSIDRKSVV